MENSTELSNSTSWEHGGDSFWVHYPYAFFMRDRVLFIMLCSMIEFSAVPLTIFLLIEILRLRQRRKSAINLLIAASRLICLGVLVAHPILLFHDNDTLCLTTYLLIPLFLLTDKLLLTAMVFVRYLYIFWPKCIRLCNSTFLCLTLIALSGVLMFGFAPLATLAKEYPPSYEKCQTVISPSTFDNVYFFLFLYFVIAINSVLLDAFCYVRVLNYIRTHLARVTVVPETAEERCKVQNIITAPANLLIHLVVVFPQIASSIALLRSPSHLGGDDVVTQIGYQLVCLFVSCTVAPILYIGSSAELRDDVLKIRRNICCEWVLNAEDQHHHHPGEIHAFNQENRASVYAIRQNEDSRL